MKVEVLKSFEKDIDRVATKKLALQIAEVIAEFEGCKSISEVSNLKKMKSKGNYFRVRIGNYRLGLKFEKDVITLIRFMHRKDIYTYFPPA